MAYISKEEIIEVLRKYLAVTETLPDSEESLKSEYGFLRGVLFSIITLTEEKD